VEKRNLATAGISVVDSFNARIHQTVRVTPAMESGLSDHVWSIAELCELLPQRKPSRQAESEMIRTALAVC